MTIHDDARAAGEAVYDSALSAKDAQIQDLTAARATALADLAVAQQAAADANAALNTAQADLANAKNQLAAAQADLVKARADLAAAQTQLATVQSQLTAAQASLKSAQTQLADMTAQRDAANAKVTQLTTQLATANQTIAQRDATIVDLKAQIAALTPAPTGPTYSPIRKDSLKAYLDAGFAPNLPRDPNATLASGAPVYVQWPSLKPDDWDLESQHRAMLDGQVLWMPERGLVYPIDSSQGFVAVDVVSYRDTFAPLDQMVIPINSKWRGLPGRTWWAMTRMRRGLIGMGEGTVIEPTASSFQRYPQAPNSRYSAYYTNKAGVEEKITGNQEKLIDHSPGPNNLNANPYIGNFVLRGRSFGHYDISPIGDPAQTDVGVAYHGIVANGATWENLFIDSGWRGHGYSPNCETGAIGVGTSHNIDNVHFDATTVGRTSLLMSNWVAGGATIDGLKVTNSSGKSSGGLVRWHCSGLHIWNNVFLPSTSNVNFEDNDPGFEIQWTGGSIGGSTYHINLRSPRGSQKITFRDVALSGGPSVLTVNIWGSGTEPRMQKAADIKAFDKAGNALPVKIAGDTAL